MTNGARQPFRILSLDGGGIRGAFTAAFAAEVEKRLGRPLADHFDLIAGTSTGAIIAVALALREPAEKIERFYRGSRTSGLRINISASSRAVCVVSISRLSALEGVFSPLSPPVGLPLSAR